MTFNVEIRPDETMQIYGVDSNKGYVIESGCQINRNEISKIQTILGAYVELGMREAGMRKWEEKFKEKVIYQPQDTWESDGYYQGYESSKKTLARAEKTFAQLSDKYQIISIKKSTI